MHHCLCISEVLGLIFEFVRSWDGPLHKGLRVGKKTLMSLARTCRLFSPLALDALWHELDSFDPLLKIFPLGTFLADDPQWLVFRQYAKRVKTFRGRRNTRAPMHVQKEFINTLQQCSKACLPLLSNVMELEWSEFSFSAAEDFGISLLRYFAGPSLTTIELSVMRFPAYSSAELSLLAALPRLCPNITSFTFVHHFLWIYDPSKEVGRMVTQWPRLQTLQTCALPQSVMDELFSRQTLGSLSIHYHKSAPAYSGRIPETIRELTLGADCPSSCIRFLKTVHASPTKFCLQIDINDRQEEVDAEETFHLLPHRLDTSQLLSLAVHPKSSVGIYPLMLREPLVTPFVEFRALHELDLDMLCTVQTSDADYESLARSLSHLRTLKLGTANPPITWPRPVASVAAVIAVLRHCPHLETFHILFDGSISPPEPSAMQDCNDTLGENVACQGWGVSNRRITRLRVSYSPIADATISAMVSCFESIMPCLLQIEHKVEGWRLVQNLLTA